MEYEVVSMRIIYKLMILTIISCLTLNNTVIFAMQTERQKQAFDTLLGYDIIENNTKEEFLSANVARFEMITMVIKMLGLDDAAKGYYQSENVKTTTFNDVKTTDGYAGYVSIAKDLGLINGDIVGNFNSNQDVRFEEVLKIMVIALGYKPLINNNLNYPDNYINMAYQLQLLKDVNLERSKAIKRSDLYTILYNSLDISLLEAEYSSKGGYFINSKKSLRKNLEQYKEKYTYKGIVYGNEDINLTTDTDINKGEIIIENIKYYAPGLNTNDLVGKSVEFYANVNDTLSMPIITQIKEKNNTNSELITSASDVIDEDSNYVHFYDDKSVKKSILLSKNYLTCYNGNLDLGFKLAEYKNLDASLKFIDNNNDGIYEVVVVSAASSAVVDHFDKDNMMLYFKYDTQINNKTLLSLDDKDYSSDFKYKIFNLNGDEILPENLKQDTAISILFSYDKKKVRIVSTGEAITGNVDELNLTDGEITINNKKYKIARINDSFVNLNVYVGKKYSFYLNSNNKIFFANEPQSADSYAFILDFLKNKGAFTNSIGIKLLTTKKDIKILNIVFPLTIEQKTTTGITSDIYRTADAAIANMSKEKVVNFELNDKGEINKLQFVQPISSLPVVRIYNDANAKDADGDLIRTDGTNIFSTASGRLFATDKNTAIFYAPDSDKNVPPFVERQYRENYILKTDKAYKTQAFDFDQETQLAKAVIIYIDPLTEEGFNIVDKTPFGMIKKVTTKLDDKGETVKSFEVITNGKEYTYELASDCYDFDIGNSLEQGDVIQYLIGYDKRFSKLYKHFSLRNINNIENFTTSTSYFGKVNNIVLNKLIQTSKVYVNTISLIDDKGALFSTVDFPTNKKNVFKIDMSKNTFSWANFDDCKTTKNNGAGNESYIFIGKNITGPIFAMIINK